MGACNEGNVIKTALVLLTDVANEQRTANKVCTSIFERRIWVFLERTANKTYASIEAPDYSGQPHDIVTDLVVVVVIFRYARLTFYATIQGFEHIQWIHSLQYPLC